MGSVIQKFRSSLGGFNRQDVLRYIEQSAAAHRHQVAELQSRLAQSEEERARLEQELSGLSHEKGSVVAEEARVRASLEEATASLTALRGELADTEGALAASRQQLSLMQTQVGELAPMAQSYGELKDRVATIELDAHRKAQATIDEANAEAARMRQETADWLEQVMGQYGALRQEMDGLMAHARTLAAMEERCSWLDGMAEELKGKAQG